DVVGGEALLRLRQEALGAVEHHEQQLPSIDGGELSLLVLPRGRLRRDHDVLPRALKRKLPCDCRLLTKTSRLVNWARRFSSKESRLRLPAAMGAPSGRLARRAE